MLQPCATTTSMRFSDRAVRLTFIVSAFTLALTVGYVAVESMPHNPMRDVEVDHPASVWWLPQGWGFFTKPAQDPMRTLFVRDDAGWSAANWRRSQFELFWGLSRRPTIQMLELTRLLDGVWDAVADDCEGDPLLCIDAYDDPMRIENPMASPTICGTVAIVEQPPVPWAWREFEDVYMPSRVALLEVTCP